MQARPRPRPQDSSACGQRNPAAREYPPLELLVYGSERAANAPATRVDEVGDPYPIVCRQSLTQAGYVAGGIQHREIGDRPRLTRDLCAPQFLRGERATAIGGNEDNSQTSEQREQASREGLEHSCTARFAAGSRRAAP